jgi:GH25 family lysozyme M1 (1,4-beta-N-acetylmuramidase)
MTVKGVDISVIQGKIDFNALKAQGIEFVIIRCGVGNQSVDKLYASNVAAAKAAGLKVMAYHFVFPLPDDGTHPGRNPAVQAKMHFDAAQGELAACDLEWPIPQDWKKWGCTAAQISQWSLDYLKAYEKLSGRKMLVYTYPNFAQTVKLPEEFAQYPLWIASYQTHPQIPKPWTDWVIWQNGGGSLMHLPNGCPVDTNVAKDLSLWDEVPAPVETPPVEETPPEPTTPVPTPPPADNNGTVFTKVVNLISSFWK